MFETISKYWAGPISNAVMVLLAVLILRPIIKKVALEQLSAAIAAMNEAKNLPNHIAGLVKAAEELRGVNRELVSLNDRIGQFDLITEQLDIVSRRIDDLQKITEERPAEVIVEADGAGENPVEIDRFEAAAELWFSAKAHIEGLIEAIVDGRVRRKYSSIPRYRYDDITSLLVRDHLITRDQADAVNAMDAAFRSIRNRKRAVTQEMLGSFGAWRNRILIEAAPNVHVPDAD
ncbi:hypothetical protein [Caulobacter sp.]|uniref:hypothetical protein n=1 Tax=Caulobacter sp. TaxID=78 RepID=UPI001B0706DD|nr:hypothetical protein [Caulobacter sp.]MBO9545655.1 hypothetical protein [Caulobacter sp.]